MQHITGISRNQMTIDSLESSIASNNPIRFIDDFIENIDLKAVGFEVQTLKTEGRPSFDTKIFLKLYLYGSLFGLRSLRKLKKECIRNIEMQWLLCGLVAKRYIVPTFARFNKYECSKFHSKTNYLTVTKFIKHLAICIRWWYKLYHPQKKEEFQNNIHITNHHQSSSLFFVQPSGLAPFLKRKKTKFLTPYDAI